MRLNGVVVIIIRIVVDIDIIIRIVVDIDIGSCIVVDVANAHLVKLLILLLRVKLHLHI